MKAKEELSVYLIVKNEEKRLSETLSQVIKVADEVVVVDSGSSDRTVDIAKEYGARVFHRDWTGYAQQKAYAASMCQNQWVLDLDADEILSDEVILSIKECLTFENIKDFAGFEMKWRYVSPFPGHPMKHAPDKWIFRLYNRQRAGVDASEHSIHDRAVPRDGCVGRLKGLVYHKSFMSLNQIEQKFCMMSSDQSKDYMLNGRNISIFRLLAEFPLKFLKYYFLEGHFRNGWYGYVFSVVSAYRNMMRFAKVLELQIMEKHR